jgi:hypothetical protein
MRCAAALKRFKCSCVDTPVDAAKRGWHAQEAATPRRHNVCRSRCCCKSSAVAGLTFAVVTRRPPVLAMPRAAGAAAAMPIRPPRLHDRTDAPCRLIFRTPLPYFRFSAFFIFFSSPSDTAVFMPLHIRRHCHFVFAMLPFSPAYAAFRCATFIMLIILSLFFIFILIDVFSSSATLPSASFFFIADYFFDTVPPAFATLISRH